MIADPHPVPAAGWPPSGPLQYALDLALERMPLRLAKPGSRSLRCGSGVSVKSPSRLVLGRHVMIQSGCVLHCGGKKWCHYGGGITLEDHTVISPGCILYGAGGIHVGAYSHLGPRSMILTQAGRDSPARTTPHPEPLLEPVFIGRGCWIGAGAVILGGTVLEDECTVAPNSVVKGRYEARQTIVGNPGRVSIRSGRGR